MEQADMSEASSGDPSPEDPVGCPECGRIPKRWIAGRCGACYEAARHGRGFRKWPPLDPEIAALLLPVPGTSRTFARRVFSYVDFEGDCWEWTGTTDEDGYGVIGRGPRGAGNEAAYRAVYLLLIGAIPEGMSYDHLCKNHACVNPDHGEIVTPGENTSRTWISKARKARTVCDFGHPLDGRRLSGKRAGERHCKTCNRDRERAKRQAA